MTNLKTANIGFNRYCGPAVLSILTGKSTDECADVIRKVNGSYNVTGVILTDLLRAADKLGFDQQNIPVSGSLYRVLTSLVNNDGMYIVTITGHFVCIEVQDKKIYFCDNHTKEPIPATSSARLGQPVLHVHKVIKREDFIEEKPKPVVILNSEEYNQVINLCHIARDHKRYCNDPGCNVSLTTLKATVDRLFIFLVGTERYQAEKMILETEWY